MYNLKIGVIESLESVLEVGTQRVDRLGVSEVQLNCWNPDNCTAENAQKILKLLDNRVTISGTWAGWNVGPTYWNFVQGPKTIGIVPETWRKERLAGYKKVADFTKMLGVKTMTSHVGFMPEVPETPEYDGFMDALEEIVAYCAKLGINFCFETGEETPVAVLRAILEMEKRGYKNVGINLDPANLLMYGKGNPSDAVDIFGKYVLGMHVKDGQYPTNGNELGCETQVGKGRVDFEYIITKLHSLNYCGPLTIEREISGENQILDIQATIEFLNNILAKL